MMVCMHQNCNHGYCVRSRFRVLVGNLAQKGNEYINVY